MLFSNQGFVRLICTTGSPSLPNKRDVVGASSEDGAIGDTASGIAVEDEGYVEGAIELIANARLQRGRLLPTSGNGEFAIRNSELVCGLELVAVVLANILSQVLGGSADRLKFLQNLGLGVDCAQGQACASAAEMFKVDFGSRPRGESRRAKWYERAPRAARPPLTAATSITE